MEHIAILFVIVLLLRGRHKVSSAVVIGVKRKGVFFGIKSLLLLVQRDLALLFLSPLNVVLEVLVFLFQSKILVLLLL